VGHDNWRGTQFETFVDRKTREVLAAELHPYDTEVEAPSAGEARLGNAWTRQASASSVCTIRALGRGRGSRAAVPPVVHGQPYR
jgi:hypothetical protein